MEEKKKEVDIENIGECTFHPGNKSKIGKTGEKKLINRLAKSKSSTNF